MSLILTPGKAPPWDPVGTTAEATAFFHRVRDRGATLNTTHVTAYNVLIKGLIDDSVWGLFDALYVFGTQNQTAALINLISDNFHCTISPTATNDLTFTPGAGFQNTDVITPPGVVNNANYLDTGFVPATGTNRFTQNLAHVSAWSFTDIVSPLGTSGVMLGGTDGTSLTQIRPGVDNGVMYMGINDPQGGPSQQTRAGTQGFWSCARISSATNVQYHNGATIGPWGSASQPLANRSIAVLARNTATVPAVATANQIAMASIGGSMDGNHMASLYNRLTAFFTTVRGAAPPI